MKMINLSELDHCIGRISEIKGSHWLLQFTKISEIKGSHWLLQFTKISEIKGSHWLLQFAKGDEFLPQKSKVYDIGLQRFWNLKIKICGKDSIPFLDFNPVPFKVKSTGCQVQLEKLNNIHVKSFALWWKIYFDEMFLSFLD